MELDYRAPGKLLLSTFISVLGAGGGERGRGREGKWGRGIRRAEEEGNKGGERGKILND